jgi:glycosyltransferase involved in cell wall biosynthesis
MTNITFFTKYTSQGATSRYRSFYFICQLLNKNYNISFHAFLDSEYLQNLYHKKPTKKLKILYAYLNRTFSLLISSQNIIIEYELFPYLPFWIEKLFLKNKRYILNFDDNVWKNYQNKFWLKNKYDLLVKNAHGVIVANDFLYKKATKLNNNIIQIPTVVDLNLYTEASYKNKHFTIVWIGTPVTYRYIKSHAKIFQHLSKKINYELCIIATQELASDPIENVNMSFINWSPENEVFYLKKAHIGIMPLDTDNFSQGKSAFKLIQYLAAGIALIGSAVGENKRVIKDGINGYLIRSNEDWINSIERLYTDRVLLEELSQNSKKDAYKYSIQKYFPLYKEFLEKTFS